MKMIGFGLLAFFGVAMFASSATAQTCTSGSPGTLTSNLNNGLAGNSCGSPTGTGDVNLANACDSSQITGAAAVFTWTVNGGSPTGNITVTPTGWDTAIFVGDGADCAAASAGFCDDKADAGAVGVAETVAVPTANKTYFLFISSFAAANACGPYTISTGTLPVKLQGFSVD